MQMISWAIQWVPQWSFTGGINSLIVNTTCVANTGGKDGIIVGTDGVGKKDKLSSGRRRKQRTKSQGQLN